MHFHLFVMANVAGDLELVMSWDQEVLKGRGDPLPYPDASLAYALSLNFYHLLYIPLKEGPMT